MTSTCTPMRTCIGCRAKRPQGELRRVAVASDGRIVMSRTAPGRGAWLCEPPQACFTSAMKRKAFDRAFRRPIDMQSAQRLHQDLEENKQATTRASGARGAQR